MQDVFEEEEKEEEEEEKKNKKKRGKKKKKEKNNNKNKKKKKREKKKKNKDKKKKVQAIRHFFQIQNRTIIWYITGSSIIGFIHTPFPLISLIRVLLLQPVWVYTTADCDIRSSSKPGFSNSTEWQKIPSNEHISAQKFRNRS